MASSPQLGWIDGWSQQAFFSVQDPLVLPRPRAGKSTLTIVDHIDWLVAGRLRRLLEQSGGSVGEAWAMNALFIGERPVSVLWYDPSMELLKSVTKSCEILVSSGRHSMCFVTHSPLSHLRAQSDEVLRAAADFGMKSLNIWSD